AIIPLMSDGKLSFSKVNQLIYIKEFVDRISTKKYLVAEVIDSLEQKFGVAPDVVTWGDHFQTELAMTAMTMTDDEFTKTVDAVRFDIIASWDIFSSNPPEFAQWVDEMNRQLMLINKGDDSLTEEEQEIVHLKILLDYQRDLAINGNFFESELIWYHNFFEESATGTDDFIAH
ncbi:MAG TPA: hypothetical protein VF857_02950, partial [Spirochaetota bacterium]